jgi:acyl-CoA reductase-like NAD-dependent aldehyde dehydrogenase
LLVHKSQYDEVHELIVQRASHLRTGAALSADGVGTGVDMGPMISRDRLQLLQDRIAAAAAQGATVYLGGGPEAHPYLNNGAFFQPTVIGEVTRAMDIAQEERKFCFRTWHLNTWVMLFCI